MYERVVAAIDHSENTPRVLAAAGELVRLSGGEIWVLHVRERAVSKFSAPDTETAQDVRQEVDAAAAELAAAGVKAHGETRHTVFGYAAQEIIASAAEHEAGVIVLGSKGRGDLAGLLLGSTAHKVIQLADRPVLVVR
ncbi:MAG: universal stress protein [Actinomycetota bacterium]|nr:universal stress protein [Actinomycetota bacterium]